jgi:hypothetical protein
MCDTTSPDDDAAGIVTTHNAADVLIEVARAAKQVEIACTTTPSGREAAEAYSTACKALTAALARVSL